MFGKKFVVKSSVVREDRTNQSDKPIIDVTLDKETLMDGPELAAAYSAVAKDFITHAAYTIGGVFVVCKIVGKICK